MYSQYQATQPQQQAANNYSYGTPAATANTTTTSSTHQWNGTQWVLIQQPQQPQQQQNYAGGYYNNNQQQQQQPQYQQYQQQPYQQQPSSSLYPNQQQPQPQQQAMNTNKTNAELVQQYTNYYHQYVALEKQQLTTGKNEAEAQWSKYHADLASRAAHYFHNNPNVTIPPPELTLPPDPSSSSTLAQQQTQQQQPQQQPQQQTQQQTHSSSYNNPNTASTTTPSRWQPQQQQSYLPQQQPQQQQQQYIPQPQQAQTTTTTTTTNKPGTASADDAMKRYVDRCLQNCDKEYVMKQIESMIQQHLQQGTLHKINWDQHPLITKETATTTPTSGGAAMSTMSSTTRGDNMSQGGGAKGNNSNYYGPSGGGGTPPDYSSLSSPASLEASIKKGGKHHKKSKKAKKRKTNEREPVVAAGGGKDYYGPAAAATSTAAATGNNDSSTYNGNYYGPNGLTRSEHKDDNADFIAVPSHNRSIKKRKQGKNGGFDQTSDTLQNRANRFQGQGGVGEAAAASTKLEKLKTDGFWDKYMGKKTIGGGNKKLDETDYEKMTIKGKCTTLEKEYLRLTAPPRAELVRPQPILEQHLENLKVEWKDKKYRHEYNWFCSQLKAVRQDCTVQRIQNEFTVDVYETHARIALEESDTNEFNQCQTQLKELYAAFLKKPNNDEAARKALHNLTEFSAYRMIYYVFLSVENQKYDASDMLKIMDSLSPQLTDSKIKHALAVRSACCADILDYHSFFSLLQECPTVWAKHLMEMIVPKLRYKALQRMWKGYRPSTVSIDFVERELGFDNAADSGREWLLSCGCVLSEDGKDWNTKDTALHESQMEAKKSLI